MQQGSRVQFRRRAARLRRRRSSTQGEALKKLTEALNEAQEKFAEVKKTITASNHPEYQKAAGASGGDRRPRSTTTRANIAQRVESNTAESVNRETMLAQAVKETKAEFDNLNARSFEYQTAEARSRKRQEALRRAGAQDQGSGHQRQFPEQLDPHRR